MSRGAYIASEDSAALRGSLRPYSGEACLEIGAGNGGNLKDLCERFELVVGTDLVRPEVMDWRAAGVNYVIADAASCFRGESFDLVVFNPPYVPSEKIVDRAVDGGRDGVEVALHFMKGALDAVKGEGRILFLLSSNNPLGGISGECAARGFALREVTERRLFYESLHVLEASAEKGRRGSRRSEWPAVLGSQKT